jgi:replicative DNA helicase
VTDLLTREPPHDALAEASVLGAMMLNAAVRAEVIGTLSGADFYVPANEAIYDAVAALDARGEPVDAVTVVAELRGRGDLSRVGGPVKVADLLSAVPAPSAGPHYAALVRQAAVLRRLGQAGARIVQLAYSVDGVSGNRELDAVAAAATAEIAHALAGAVSADGRASTVGDLVDALVASLDLPPADSDSGPAWGWRDLDEVMNRLTPGKLVVIGARPSVGKSLVLGCIAASVAVDQGAPALLHTLEMSRTEVMQRLLARHARIELGRIIRHEVASHERERVDHAADLMRGAPLVVDETRGLTPVALRASIRRQKPRPVVVLIDYLQLMRQGDRAESRLQEVSAIARTLKEIAGEEGVCIVTGAQLNRQAAADRAPIMADLRESGEIEQSADDVVLLDRDKDGKRVPLGEVALIVEKNRQGAAGLTVHLANQSHYGRFSDLARH